MRRTIRLVAFVGAVVTLYLAAALQIGPDVVDANICALAKRWGIADGVPCAPWIDALARVVTPIVLLACIAILLFDFVAWLRERRTKSPNRTPQRSLHIMESIWWISNRSAWGRWQDAQVQASGGIRSELNKLHLAEQVVRQAAEDGLLQIRARKKNSTEYSDLPRDFWRVAYIDLQPNTKSLWKASIKPRHGAGAPIPEYDDVVVDRHQMESLWPERSWLYKWHILRLKVKALVKTMTEKKPPNAITETANDAQAPNASTISLAEPEDQSASKNQSELQTEVNVTLAAPNHWEKLFVIGDEGKSVWLHFLPDKKKQKAETLLLILYGHKVILGTTRVHVRAAHAAVAKTIDTAPNAPSDPFRWILGAATMLQQGDDFAEEYVGHYYKRVALSQGGMYELTPSGEQHAASLAYDLISRAD